MRSPTQREWVMLGLLALIALVMLYIQSGGISGRVGQQDAAEASELGDAPHVQLERLAQSAEGYDPEGRNLFQYGPPPSARRKAAPPPPPPPPPRPRAKAPPRAKARPAPPRSAGKPKPPTPNFKYLGYLGPKENRIAVFEPQAGQGGQEETMLLAGRGDVVEKEFLLVEFRYETVILGFTDRQFADQTTELTITGKDK